MEPPAPSPEMVSASRRHLTERYASGVDLLLWETEKRLIPDLDAKTAVAAQTARRPEPEHAAQAAGDDASEQQP